MHFRLIERCRTSVSISFLFLVLFLNGTVCIAIAPQFWEENTQGQFADGDAQGISINSEGELLLAPQLKKVLDGSEPIIWKIIRDSKGNLYAATGNQGKIIKIDVTGKASTVLDANELEVHTIVLDKSDNLYAATSPDGKIYKVKPDGSSSVFFDPDDKYIWSLALDDAGVLYAGTGDQGKIYKIEKDGKGKVLIDTNENNITVLAWDKEKKLLAGSDRNGILYSIDSAGKAFVLFDSELQQITSIYCRPTGEIYFSAITGIAPGPGAKPVPEIKQPSAPAPEPDQDVPSSGEEGEAVVSIEVSGNSPPVQTLTPQRPSGASELYRISPEGFAEVLYTVPEDQILDISGFKDNMILVSTGKKAKLISVDENKRSTILLKAPEEQITSLLAAAGKIWAATANPGNIYELIEEHSAKGTYYSDVKDTQTTSTWGQISWKATIPQGTSLNISTRSGNTKVPDETWSDWKPAGSDPAGKQVQNPKARFIQWKADFATTDSKTTPSIRSVQIAYLQQNLRPEILSITIHPLGVVYRKAQLYAQDSFAGVAETSSPEKEQQDLPATAQPAFDTGGLGKREYRKGFQTITWVASDENQDDLRFDLYYRAEEEKGWKLLATNLKDRVYAWDTQTLPDGTYTVKVIANDSGSNPKEFVLSNSRESDPFDIDNSPPKIEVVRNSTSQNVITIEVRAEDQFSSIKDMQYSVTPGEWVVVFPIDLINDSPAETYKIELKDLPKETSQIIFRCSDRVRNVSTIKYKLHR
jgi:hypothetical protein